MSDVEINLTNLIKLWVILSIGIYGWPVGAIAQELSASDTPSESIFAADPATPILKQGDRYHAIQLSQQEEAPLNRINSVSELSDVQPTDWAYQALGSLAERYNCLLAYPDRTYRGNRALTRYEFAAGLNECLQRLQVILEEISSEIGVEDLEQIRRLEEEFSAELATLHGRIDALEIRTAELEATQFSPTTKLRGLATFNITGAAVNGDVKVETTDLFTPLEIRPAGRNSVTNEPIVRDAKDDPKMTLSSLVWLTFETSFEGPDRLVAQLAVANGNSPANTLASAGLYNTFGVPFTDQSQAPDVGTTEVVLRELFYDFPVGERVRVVVGPQINWYRYFDVNAFTFFLTGASSFNAIGSPLLDSIKRGAGVVGLWNISDRFQLNASYLSENTEFLPSPIFNTASDPSKGLFDATNTIAAQLTVKPLDTANIRLIYMLTNIDPNVPIFDGNGNQTGTGIGGATGGSIYGVADDGFGGSLATSTAHAFGLNFDWLITPRVGVFGRYTYTTTEINPKTSGRNDGHINAQSFQVGMAFPDLVKEGAQGTLSFLIPFDVLDGRKFLVSGGGDGGTQYEIEATYYYPLNDNIAIAPSVYFIANPNNFEDNPTIVVGNIRTQFSF